MAAMNDPNLFPFSSGFEFSSKWLESEGYFLTVVANIYIVSIGLFSFSARALWDGFDAQTRLSMWGVSKTEGENARKWSNDGVINFP